jgi:hypothetical protein
VVDAPSAQDKVLVAAARPGPAAPRGKRFAVKVQTSDRTSVVPVRGPVVFMPIHLHWGLNRIKLSLATPKPTSPQVLYLAGLSLES